MKYFRRFGALFFAILPDNFIVLFFRRGGKEHQMKKYYICSGEKLYQIDQEVYHAITQLTNRIHYQMGVSDACVAGRRGMVWCEGDCVVCRYWSPREVSVEERDQRNDGQIADTTAEMLLRCEDIIADMARVDPDCGDRIGRMNMAGYDQRFIARALGLPVSTYRDRVKRIGRIIRR